MKIISGKVPHAKKITIYGSEGIGKSTFASNFPAPIFIDTEGSTKELDVNRFERPTSWTMLLEEIQYVNEHKEICKTLVIDTIDWAEQMCIEHICTKHQKSGLESFGYGSGYIYVREEFGRFLNRLEDVVENGINVVLIAHAQLRKFEQPDEMGAYDRWELKLGKKTASQISPLVKEWSDALLFANYKTFVINVDGQGAQKGKNKAQGGKRVMYTTHHSCWDAKNRYGLPDEVPFNYESIRHILEDSLVAKRQTENTQEKSVTINLGSTDKAQKQHQTNKTLENKQSSVTASNTGRTEPEKKAQEASQMDDGKEPVNAPARDSRGFTDIPPDPADREGIAASELDPRIPKKLRDLMIANEVCEWDIQNVVEARGYFPGDMPVADYPEDFIEGCLVAAWDKVYGMVKEMKANDSLVFN